MDRKNLPLPRVNENPSTNGCIASDVITRPTPPNLILRNFPKRVAEKFPPGRLAEYLRAPDAHYAWTRMPDFHLSEAEAKELEQWLFAAAPPPPTPAPASTDAALVEKGKTLVQTAGCLNCHSLKLDNRFAAPKLADLRRIGGRPAAWRPKPNPNPRRLPSR